LYINYIMMNITEWRFRFFFTNYWFCPRNQFTWRRKRTESN